jgi:hypothetical protein
MLGGKAVEVGYVENLSREAVRQPLMRSASR